MKETEQIFNKTKLESPGALKVMEGVDAFFKELDFTDNAVGRAERKKWPRVDAQVTVIINDPDVASDKRNITVTCRFEPSKLEAHVKAEIARVASEKGYVNPLVESVRVVTAGYEEDGTEIEPGIDRQTVPLPKKI